jgi:cytochrome c5
MMKFLSNRTRKLSIALAATMIATAFLIASVPGKASSDEDAALYKSKCAMCHGQSAEKKFDATKADEELIQIVLKGKKLEKPPNMPSFEEKGLTADQAKALVAFMKAQKH